MKIRDRAAANEGQQDKCCGTENAKIVVTAEMIEAGVQSFDALAEAVSTDFLVEQVYIAMAQINRRCSKGSEN